MTGPPAGWDPDQAAERIRARAHRYPENQAARQRTRTADPCGCYVCAETPTIDCRYCNQESA